MQTLATALDWVVQVLGPGLELASTRTLDTRQVRGRRGQSRLPSEVGGATILITPPHTSSGWGKPNTLSGEISAFVCYSSSLRDNRRIHGGIFFNMPHAQINLLIFTLKELFSQFDWKC